MNVEKIGSFIKEKRIEKKLTQEDLATKLYVTNKAISRWETGKSLPEIETFYLLSKELDISINEILEAGENTKEEVKKYYDKNKKKQILIDIFLIVIIFVFPAICMFGCAFSSSSILGALLSNNFNYQTAVEETSNYIMNYTLSFFIIPWIIFLISYIGYKLNKKILIHITSIICILIVLDVMLFSNGIIGSSILELFILVFNFLELQLLKKINKC